jgi:GT2 family glycosyltransferase
MLSNLLAFLNTQDSVEKTVVYDNGYVTDSGKGVLSSHPHVVDAVGWKFYSMWNDAWRMSNEESFDVLMLLNDDIELAGDSIKEAAEVLVNDPSIGVVGFNYNKPVNEYSLDEVRFRRTRGTYKDGGIWGCAFAVKPSTWGVVPPIDERYNLWYGDDELLRNMERHGFTCGIAQNAPVFHMASTTTNMFPELLAKTDEDRVLFQSKFT